VRREDLDLTRILAHTNSAEPGSDAPADAKHGLSRLLVLDHLVGALVANKHFTNGDSLSMRAYP
jgi:hypothetical protein